MSDLTGLAEGDKLVVQLAHTSTPSYVTVKRVARVWLTDHQDHRYRIKDGKDGDEPYSAEAMTYAEWDTRQETKRLTTRLASVGWHPRPSLSLSQLRRAASLISEFEAERTGGVL